MSKIYYAIKFMQQSSKGLYNYYEVAKFEDGEVQPKDVYDVEIHKTSGKSSCNCPAGMYHRKPGIEDKHVVIVKKWVAAGSPTPAIVEVS